METISIDNIPRGDLPVFHVSQGDDGRELKIKLLENGSPLIVSFLDEEDHFFIDIKPPKSDAIRITANFVSGSDYVTFKTSESFTSESGKALCKLREITDTSDIGFGNFLLDIEKAP